MSVGSAGQFVCSGTGTFINLSPQSIVPTLYLSTLTDNAININNTNVNVLPSVVTPALVQQAANAPMLGSMVGQRVASLAAAGFHRGGSFWDSLKNAASSVYNVGKSIASNPIAQAVGKAAFHGLTGLGNGSRRVLQGAGFIAHEESESPLGNKKRGRDDSANISTYESSRTKRRLTTGLAVAGDHEESTRQDEDPLAALAR